MGFIAPAIAAVGSALGGVGAAATGAAGAAGMSSLGTALTIGSGVLSAGGQILGGIQANNMGKYQAKVAQNNAAIMEQQADTERLMGQRAETEQKFKAGQIREARRATTAANGVDVGYGTPKLLDYADEALADLDAMTIRYNAAREAYGDQVKANNYRADASMARSAGKSALIGSFIGAASSITGTLGKLADRRYEAKHVGVK